MFARWMAVSLTINDKWRRRRDSNPRDPFESNGFQDRRFQPLTHSSASKYNLQTAFSGIVDDTFRADRRILV
jgi:hypothetical protein